MVNPLALADPASGPFYLKSCPVSTQHFAKLSRHQEVAFTSNDTSDTIWCAFLCSACARARARASCAPLCFCSCCTVWLLCLASGTSLSQNSTRRSEAYSRAAKPAPDASGAPSLSFPFSTRRIALTPDPTKQAVSEGLTILAGAPLLLVHCQTKGMLSAEPQAFTCARGDAYAHARPRRFTAQKQRGGGSVSSVSVLCGLAKS